MFLNVSKCYMQCCQTLASSLISIRFSMKASHFFQKQSTTSKFPTPVIRSRSMIPENSLDPTIPSTSVTHSDMVYFSPSFKSCYSSPSFHLALGNSPFCSLFPFAHCSSSSHFTPNICPLRPLHPSRKSCPFKLSLPMTTYAPLICCVYHSR